VLDAPLGDVERTVERLAVIVPAADDQATRRLTRQQVRSNPSARDEFER
jgi:hypothetical protein